MEDISNVLGHRLSLDSIAEATLGTKKSGHGLDAIRYFREGNMEALKKYCTDDVRITRDIFEYGKTNSKLMYFSKYRPDQLTVPVDWSGYKWNLGTQSQPDLVVVDTPKVDRGSGNYSLF